MQLFPKSCDKKGARADRLVSRIGLLATGIFDARISYD